MATTTENIGLTKPAETDYYDVGVFNTNADLIDAAVGEKANRVSPIFTGTPKAPTPASNDDSTRIATTAFVKTLFNNTGCVTGRYEGEGESDEPKTKTISLGFFPKLVIIFDLSQSNVGHSGTMYKIGFVFGRVLGTLISTECHIMFNTETGNNTQWANDVSDQTYQTEAGLVIKYEENYAANSFNLRRHEYRYVAFK